MNRRLLAVSAGRPSRGRRDTSAAPAHRTAAPGAGQITLTTPGAGPLRGAARDAGYAWQSLPLGGSGADGAGAARDALLAAGATAGGRRRRRLPERDGVRAPAARRSPARGARRVLHVHDMVRRVPRFWRRADVVLADSQRRRRAARAGCAATSSTGPVDPDPPAVDRAVADRRRPGRRLRRADRAAQGPARPRPRRAG